MLGVLTRIKVLIGASSMDNASDEFKGGSVKYIMILVLAGEERILYGAGKCLPLRRKRTGKR